MRKTTKEEFLLRARAIHGGKYDYSKATYVNARNKITIICPIHGEFSQKAMGHLTGKGCQQCGYESMADAHRKSVEQFVIDAVLIHGNKYDYSKIVNYKNCYGKLEIICPVHGSFWQSSVCHLGSKSGCPACLRKSHSLVGVLLHKIFPDWTIIPNKKIWSSFGNYHRRRYCDYWMEFENFKIMVEYDGQQHFRPVQFGGMIHKKAVDHYELQKTIDLLDIDFCIKNQVLLWRIRFDQDLECSLFKLKEQVINKIEGT